MTKRKSITTIGDMKRNKANSFALIRDAALKERSSLGSKKAAKLRAAGCAGSSTLLHDEVAKEHGTLLFQDYKKHIGAQFSQELLRYLTVIHELTVLDRKTVERSWEVMIKNLRAVLTGKCWWLGVIETEIVSIEFLRKLQAQDENSRNKLQLIEVLEKQVGIVGSDTPSRVLVHAHIVIDLGERRKSWNRLEQNVRDELTQIWNGPRQIELKKFSEQWAGRNRSVWENIKHIAHYGTKCGNEMLRYKAGYGRDYEEDTEAKMWKSYGKQLVSNEDDGSVEDARSLTGNEIKFLDQITRMLMDRRGSQGRGYVIGTRLK